MSVRITDTARAAMVNAVAAVMAQGALLVCAGKRPERLDYTFDVDDDERQLGVDRKANRFGLERYARSRARSHTDGARIRRTDRCADGCNLIFSLKHADAELAELGEAVQ